MDKNKANANTDADVKTDVDADSHANVNADTNGYTDVNAHAGADAEIGNASTGSELTAEEQEEQTDPVKDVITRLRQLL